MRKSSTVYGGLDVHKKSIDTDAAPGTRRCRGHWGTLDNVVGGPACSNAREAISVPAAKAAPRRIFVLRTPPLAYQHRQPSHNRHTNRFRLEDLRKRRFESILWHLRSRGD
jgi:hypothetical protein